MAEMKPNITFCDQWEDAQPNQHQHHTSKRSRVAGVLERDGGTTLTSVKLINLLFLVFTKFIHIEIGSSNM